MRTSPMLDKSTTPPEFLGTVLPFSPMEYPLHARDSYSYAKLVFQMISEYDLPVSTSARQILESMCDTKFSNRPTLDKFIKSDFFENNLAIKIVSQLIDLRNGGLSADASNELFLDMPNALNTFSSNKPLLGMVVENLTKFSVVVHPAAWATGFIKSFFTMKQENNAPSKTPKIVIKGLLAPEEYVKIVVPFIADLWCMERPGLALILLRTVGRYIYRLTGDFLSAVIVKRTISLNILSEPGLTQPYLDALPIILKALLRESRDVAPIVRHLVQQIPLFSGNESHLRTKALTCLLVHPKIPSLLIKEYLAKGLTDPSPQVRLNVLTSARKFAFAFADNNNAMSAKVLADAIMGSMLLSMVDQDAEVRRKARNTIRKLTFVMGRKEEEIEAFYASQHKSNPTSPQSGPFRSNIEVVSSQSPSNLKTKNPSQSSTVAPQQTPISQTTISSFSTADDWDNDDFDSVDVNAPIASSIKPHHDESSPPSKNSRSSGSASSSKLGSVRPDIEDRATDKIGDDDEAYSKVPALTNSKSSTESKNSMPSTPKGSKHKTAWSGSWESWDDGETDDADGLVGAPQTPLSSSKASLSASWEESADVYVPESPKTIVRATGSSNNLGISKNSSFSDVDSTSTPKTLSKPPSKTYVSFDHEDKRNKFEDEPEEEIAEEIKVTVSSPSAPVIASKSFELNTNDDDELDAWGNDDDFGSSIEESAPKETLPSEPQISLSVDQFESDSNKNEIKDTIDTEKRSEEQKVDQEKMEEKQHEQIREKSSSSLAMMPSADVDQEEDDLGDWGEDFDPIAPTDTPSASAENEDGMF